MDTAVPPLAPTADKPPRSRRWIPLSLRMFVAMIVILGVIGVLWVGVPAYRQNKAIREIERMGGSVGSRWNGPAWLRTWISDDLAKVLGRVEEINLESTSVTDASLVHVSQFNRIADALFE